MTSWMWVVLIIAVLAVIALAVMAERRRRTTSLQRRFGPEYDQTLAASEGKRAAEAQLQGRAHKRARLNIVPLSETERLRSTDQWRAVQEQFVDRPAEAVSSAAQLLTQVMQQRGYPVTDFDEQADLVSVDHPRMVQDYRTAHGIHQRNLSHQATTEDLREALLRYRSLFDELLRPDPDQDQDQDPDPDRDSRDDQTMSRHAAGLREGDR